MREDKTENRLQFYPAEIFKEIFLEDKLQLRYAISNFGRFVSFTDKIELGRIVKGSEQDGYRIWRYEVLDEHNKRRYKHRFFYKLVAEYFLPKNSEEQIYVLHLNYNRSNDFVENLKWATYAEMLAHGKKSPFVIASRKRQYAENKAKRQHKGNKLTSTQVMLLKKILLDPARKTRMKILARQFGVSEMTLYRIKSGKNWGHIKT